MPFVETFTIRGHVIITVRDSITGRLLKKLSDHNVVTKNAKLALVDLLTQQSTDPNAAEYNKLWSIYVGDGTTAPAATDTNLAGANIFGKELDQPITKASGGVDGLIEATMTLGSGDANGITLSEVGLFTRGDGTLANPPAAEQRMVARQVHGAISKTSGITVSYKWLYQITT
jgi:hypothetical protein